jgi:probable phosphoglycerate mutase
MARDSSCEVVLLRHAHSTANLKGLLAGRDNRVGLSERGKKEALELADYLLSQKFDAIYSSPLKRCQETLAPYLQSAKPEVKYVDELVEMEYGEWSGKSLARLSKEKLWGSIQSRPSTVRFPKGESFLEMSGRANQIVLDLAKNKARILMVTHGDVIKAIVAFHLGMPLDSFQRILIDPASITRIKIPSSQLLALNSISHLVLDKSHGREKRDPHNLGGGAGRI